MLFADKPSKGEASMYLSDYIQPECVLLCDPKDRDETLTLLSTAVARIHPTLSKQKIFEAVIQREKIVSTGIGGGVALPHAKLEESKEFSVAVAICKSSGVEWNAIDGNLVKFVFLIIGPSKQQKAYLKLLSELTTLLRQERFLELIAGVSQPESLIKIFKQYERFSV